MTPKLPTSASERDEHCELCGQLPNARIHFVDSKRDGHQYRPKPESDTESVQSVSPSEKGEIYRHGFNNAMEGARALLKLDVEIADFENHECRDGEFVPCLACDSVRAREVQQRELIDRWARQWAMLLIASKDPIRASLGEMLKLVEDGILIRNTADDGDFQSYLVQANRLAVVLKNAQTARNSS